MSFLCYFLTTLLTLVTGTSWWVVIFGIIRRPGEVPACPAQFSILKTQHLTDYGTAYADHNIAPASVQVPCWWHKCDPQNESVSWCRKQQESPTRGRIYHSAVTVFNSDPLFCTVLFRLSLRHGRSSQLNSCSFLWPMTFTFERDLYIRLRRTSVSSISVRGRLVQ